MWSQMHGNETTTKAILIYLITYIRMIKMQRKFWRIFYNWHNFKSGWCKVLHQRNANLIGLNRDAKNLNDQKVQFKEIFEKQIFV
jgi:hypothetical protein